MNADTQTTLSSYIAAISSAYATGKATGHSYRPAIKALIEGFAPDVVATNEPKRILRPLLHSAGAFDISSNLK